MPYRPWPKGETPLIPPANPFQSFMLFLCVASSFPLLRGDTGSRVLEAALDDTAVIAWGATMLIGSLLTIIGMGLGAKWHHVGLVLERTGLILVAGAAALYTVALVESAGIQSIAYTVGLHAAFSAACFWRAVQITRGLRWVEQRLRTYRDLP